MINLSKLESSNVDELIEDVYSVLQDLPFSTDIDESVDEENYTDSIDALVKQVGVELSKTNLPFELSTQDKARITRSLKTKLLPRPLTKAEQQISAIIKGTDLVREEDIQQIKYKSILSSVYGTSNPGMDSWRRRIFEDNLALATIVDTRGEGMIIDSDRKLNNNIINYQESQYKIIRDYLTKYHLQEADVEQFPKNLYVTSTKNNKVKIKTQNHYNTITAMYNIIESLKSEGTFLDSIENGWNEDIDKVKQASQNRDLYNAVNAFINLTYFDDVLKQSLSKFINVGSQANPIQFTLDGYGTPTYQYKYQIAAGNSNARKTWGDDVQDSLEEMAKFSQVLINRISLYDYKDEVEQWGRLEPKDFVGTVVKLKSAGTLVTDNEFKDAVENLTKDQSRRNGNLQTIFKKLFVDKNQNIIRELESRGFDYNNMNVLYSIYRTVFDTRKKTKQNGRQNKSWLEIEDAYLKENGIRSRYNLVETMYGLICSNTALNYLQTVYDFDTQTTKTAVKDKYSISKTKFDIINDINDNTIKRLDSAQLLDEYKLTPMADGKSYSINIAGKDYQIKVNGLGINLLSKKNVSASRFQIKELEGLKDVSLNTREQRNALVSRHNLTAQETQLADVLSFIDNMLNTDFSKNTQSLNELVISMKGRPNFLHDVFMSAARALVIQDIYNDFRKATKEDGSTYALTELRTFLKDSGKFPGIYDARNLYEYFRTDFDGYQLTTVDSNEPWVVKLANTRALLANDTSKSVISNLDGDKIPNFSPAFLSGDIKTQMRESNEAGGPTAYLLFSGNRKAVLDVTIDTDVRTKDGKVKQIKNMTEGELLYNALVNKFLLPLHEDGTVFTQSTTQSDKTKFIADHISLGDIIIDNQKLTDLIKSPALEQAVVSKLKSTIGTAYNKVYERVIEDYKRLFPQIKGIDDISKVLKGIPTKLATGEEVTINSEKDLMNAVNSYNKANPNNTITLYKDLHYRQIKGKKLAFNELLYEFATNLYNPNDSTRLNQRLALEKRRFLKNLLEKQFSIPVDEQMKSIMKQTFGLNTKQWIKKIGGEEYVVLAKSGNEDILYGSIDDNADFTLNPMLNAYFLIDNLIGNNLRFSTTGSEINHKIKALAKLDLKKKIKNENLNKRNILFLNPEYDQNVLTFYDLKKMIDNGKELIANGAKVEGVPLENTIADLEAAYDDQIYAMENLGQNAQFKRNVIMSATMTKMVPSLEGICEQMNIACISDVSADVFNFSGKTDAVDAHDGSAQLSPFWSILENKSLGPNEVGTIKKPIQHYYDDRYMTATLLKYATDTITNQWMRQSVGNDLNSTKHAINLHNIFRKMHSKRWHVVDAQGKSIEGAWNDGEIDLIKGCGYKADHEISFADDIMEQNLYPNNQLYYNRAGNHIKITDFGRERGVYYTIEQAVDQGNQPIGEEQKVYHYFDNTGSHIPSESILENTPYHTIDSLFELHTSLGGIWSESYNGENFVYSEGSNIAVTNYINHVATLKEGADPKDLSIKSYDQPLKRAMIHVLANNSAVKNGVGNINPTSSWYDDTEFSYMTIGSDTYGIQQDSDHTADEAHMTEFSQVISSLDAGGYLHDYVTQIYQQLGQTALDLSKVELDAVAQFRESGDMSAIYDVIGRTIMANIKSGSGEIGLAEAIINNIKAKFNLNTDHSLDKLKIPFSDPNIYSSILSTFVSNINKKSIKRQYPGLGTVMVPSYNMSMIYDINGMTYQFEDLVKEATEKGFSSTELDNTKAKQDIVKQYLSTIQQSMPVYEDGQSFIPTENVLVTLEGTNALGQTGTFYEHISLNEIHDYYNFQDNPQEYLQKRGYSNISSMKFQKDVTVPRNLAPVRITWDYVDALGVQHHTNIFNHWRVKGQIQELAQIDDMNISGDEKKRLSAEAVKKWDVDKAFHDIKKGVYELAQGAEPVKISNLKNEAAEIIMSNLYASKFGIKAGDSLVDVLKKGKSYFSTPTVSVESDNYDLVFTKGNGNHTFITFKPLQKNSSNCMSFYRAWDNINKRKYQRKYEVSENSPTVVNRIYAITGDNVRLFEIGREIVRDDIVWDNKKEAFVKGGKKVENQNTYRRDGDRVLQYIEFVSKHRVDEIAEDGSIVSYDLYNINRSAIKQCLEQKQYSDAELTYTNAEGHTSKLTPEQKFDQEVNQYISRLLGNIYKSDEYGGVQLNKSLSFGSGKILQETLYNFSKEIDYDQDLSEYVVSLHKIMQAANPNKNDNNRFKIAGIKLKKALAAFDAKNQNKQYTSFQKAQSFTVARIPAQTLQSFMKMKNVGFTGTETGQCFVTAWQTWLQGSDYDIDKAYVMGLCFDTNGKYVGWSNLFDYSTDETLAASEYLPMPQKIRHTVINDAAAARANLAKQLTETTDENRKGVIENRLKQLDHIVDLDPWIERISSEQDQASKIRLYADLINEINRESYQDGDSKTVNISYTNPNGLEVVKNLNKHEFTQIPPNLSQDVSKNFISSHIQNTVQDLVNMTRAYSPIEMEDFRAASGYSPKQKAASEMTLLNPTTKYLMQYSNMTGKNVIGIAANGEKSSFMWHYYLNDLIRHGNAEKRKYGHFQFTTSRIIGRAKENIQPGTITGLPDLNMDGVDPNIQAEFGSRITGNLYVDLMISQVLSAATDNAKELILAKVNAGNKLAKMYLFLITVGMNIDDIVTFMTSPVASFIDSITEENIFGGTTVDINTAISFARGQFMTNGKINPKMEARYGALKMLQIKEAYEKAGLGNPENIESVVADCDEFQNVLEGANEFSNFGRFLGLNQGLPTSKVDLQKLTSFIQSILSQRVEATLGDNKVSSEIKEQLKDAAPMDVLRWLKDANYRQQIADEYDQVKKCINIFDAFTHIQQFDAIRDILSTVIDIDSNLSFKSKAFNAVFNQAKSTYRYISEKYQKKMLGGIDAAIITNFIQNQNISIPVIAGTKYLQADASTGTFKEDGLLYLDNRASIASFKYIFENVIIPKLKQGIVTEVDQDGNISEKKYTDLANNPFISGLLRSSEQKVPLYKVGLNMMTIKDSTESQKKYQAYSSGLQALSKYKVGDQTLSDLFMLYNLVVNKNQYGASRLTTLFDAFISKNQSMRLLSKYFDYLGKVDYYGVPRLDTDMEFDSSKYSKDAPILNLSYKDILVSAASNVRSTKGQTDPYCIQMTEDGPVIMERIGTSYQPMQGFLRKGQSEDQNHYLERVNNERSYFVLGGQFSDYLQNQLNTIQELKDSDNIISYINNFIRDGLLTVSKVCE